MSTKTFCMSAGCKNEAPMTCGGCGKVTYCSKTHKSSQDTAPSASSGAATSAAGGESGRRGAERAAVAAGAHAVRVESGPVELDEESFKDMAMIRARSCGTIEELLAAGMPPTDAEFVARSEKDIEALYDKYDRGDEPDGTYQTALKAADDAGMLLLSAFEWSRDPELEARGLDLLDRAVVLLRRVEHDSSLCLSINLQLANALALSQNGDVGENVEMALDHFDHVFLHLTRDDTPTAWAEASVTMGRAFQRRVVGDHEDNVESAVVLWQQALEVYTRRKFPREYSEVHALLGRFLPEKARNQWEEGDLEEEAIGHLKKSVDASLELPASVRAARHSLLAMAYDLRAKGARHANLDLAVDHLRKELSYRERPGDDPAAWGSAVVALAAKLQERGRTEADIEEVLKLIRESEQVVLAAGAQNLWLEMQVVHVELVNARRKTGPQLQNLLECAEVIRRAIETVRLDGTEVRCQMLSTLFSRGAATHKKLGLLDIPDAMEHFEVSLDYYAAMQQSINLLPDDLKILQSLRESVRTTILCKLVRGVPYQPPAATFGVEWPPTGATAANGVSSGSSTSGGGAGGGGRGSRRRG